MIKGGFLLLCLIVGVVAFADAQHAGADSVMATVAVGTTPQQIQLSPNGSELFVSNEGSNTVSVISTSSDSVIDTVPVGLNPGPIRFTPNGAKAYVVNEDADTVSVIDVASHGVTATVVVGDRPITLSRSDDGTKVYVANELSNDVSVISTATDEVTGKIAVGTAPHTMAKTPDGSKLYVANEGADSNSVSVISTASDAVVATISLLPSRDPGSIHFLPNGSRAYVANRGCAGLTCVPLEVDPTVSVIDVATDSVIKTIDVGVPGDAPHAMRITPDGAKLYLVNKHGDEVIVIDTATNAILKNIQLQNGSCSNPAFGVGSCPVRIELAPDGSKAYVLEQRPLAANGALTRICAGVVPAVCGGINTDTVLGSVAVGYRPADLEIMGGSKAYISNSGSNSVSVVALPVDSDSDGCPDARELQTAAGSQFSGGLRDYLNPWDYFNPTHDGQNRIEDVLEVVRDFFIDDADSNPGLPPYTVGYDPGTDRSFVGPDAWDLGPPDGLHRVVDILNQLKQFFHDCA